LLEDSFVEELLTTTTPLLNVDVVEISFEFNVVLDKGLEVVVDVDDDGGVVVVVVVDCVVESGNDVEIVSDVESIFVDVIKLVDRFVNVVGIVVVVVDVNVVVVAAAVVVVVGISHDQGTSSPKYQIIVTQTSGKKNKENQNVKYSPVGNGQQELETHLRLAAVPVTGIVHTPHSIANRVRDNRVTNSNYFFFVTPTSQPNSYFQSSPVHSHNILVKAMVF
jgi:hypothetical protein